MKTKLGNLIARIFWRISGGRRLEIGRRCEISLRAVIETKGGSIRIGERSRISVGACLMAWGGTISIGKNCSVNPYAVIYGHGGLKIGDGVRIAAHVTIIPSNHNFDDIDTPIRLQSSTSKGIVIEDDVWIGTHAVILDGAHVAKGCVIAAGAVVRGKLEPYGVYAGVPARLIKKRGG